MSPFLYNPLSSVWVAHTLLGVGPSSRAYSTYQGSYHERKLTLPPLETIPSFSVRDGGSWAPPSLHARKLTHMILCRSHGVTTAAMSSSVQQSCHIQNILLLWSSLTSDSYRERERETTETERQKDPICDWVLRFFLHFDRLGVSFCANQCKRLGFSIFNIRGKDVPIID